MRIGDYPEQLPRRPAPTPAFVCAWAFWAASALAYSASLDIASQRCAYLAIALGACTLSAVGFAFVGHRGWLRFVLCGLLAGACLAFSYGAGIHARADALAGFELEEAEFEIVEDSQGGSYGERVLMKALSGEAAGAVVQAQISDGKELRYGEHVRVSGVLAAPDERSRISCWQKGASLTLSAPGAQHSGYSAFPRGWLAGARSVAVDAIGADDDAHALLQAIVCGYRRSIRSASTYADYQTCGLAHLVAVSGAHLVIVTGLLASMLHALRVPRRPTTFLLAVSMASYLVVAGAPVSALRAVLMSTIGIFAHFGRRRASSMNALGVGMVVLIAANPATAVSASFALSTLSTAGILLFADYFAYLLSRTPVRHVRWVGEALALTLSASALSQAYACALFAQLPIASPLANVACAPLFPLVCGLGLAGAVVQLLGLPGCGFVMMLSIAAAGFMNQLVGLIASLPFACIPCAIDPVFSLALTALAGMALWLLWPLDLKRIAVACCIVLGALGGLHAYGLGGDRIVMLDVGQGDAFLVASRGQTMLIDTGNQDKLLLSALGALGIAHIDSVLLTHADDDHYGSLDVLARTVEVDRVLVAEGMFASVDASCRHMLAEARAASREIQALAYGDVMYVGAFELRVIWPKSFSSDGGNADSICLALGYDGDADGTVDFKALFTGDAETDELAEMLAAHEIGDIDLLKVGHHGSRNAMSAEQLRFLSPEIALIGVGAHNRYGHPTAEVLEMLESASCKVYRSDVDGTVTINFSPQSMSKK